MIVGAAPVSGTMRNVASYPAVTIVVRSDRRRSRSRCPCGLRKSAAAPAMASPIQTRAVPSQDADAIRTLTAVASAAMDPCAHRAGLPDWFRPGFQDHLAILATGHGPALGQDRDTGNPLAWNRRTWLAVYLQSTIGSGMHPEAAADRRSRRPGKSPGARTGPP